MAAWLLLVFGHVHQSPVVRERVDVVELNHTYDDSGAYRFSQLIFWEWNSDTRSHRVVDWRMATATQPVPVPIRRRDRWVIRWIDHKSGGVMREVEFFTWRVESTMHDRELVERYKFPEYLRRKLR